MIPLILTIRQEGRHGNRRKHRQKGRLNHQYNEDANRLAEHASGYQPMINATSAVGAGDWRKEIVDYLKDPSKKVERRVRFQATKYVLLENELYYRTIDGILLRCLGDDEARSLMGGNP